MREAAAEMLVVLAHAKRNKLDHGVKIIIDYLPALKNSFRFGTSIEDYWLFRSISFVL